MLSLLKTFFCFSCSSILRFKTLFVQIQFQILEITVPFILLCFTFILFRKFSLACLLCGFQHSIAEVNQFVIFRIILSFCWLEYVRWVARFNFPKFMNCSKMPITCYLLLCITLLVNNKMVLLFSLYYNFINFSYFIHVRCLMGTSLPHISLWYLTYFIP